MCVRLTVITRDPVCDAVVTVLWDRTRARLSGVQQLRSAARPGSWSSPLPHLWVAVSLLVLFVHLVQVSWATSYNLYTSILILLFPNEENKNTDPTDEIPGAVPQRSSSSTSAPGLVVLHVGLQPGLVAHPLLSLLTPAFSLLLDLQHSTSVT